MLLEPEQIQLLQLMVEADRSVPREERGGFGLSSTVESLGVRLLHPGIQGGSQLFPKSDIEKLVDNGLVRLSYTDKGSERYSVTPAGYKIFNDTRNGIGRYSGDSGATMRVFISHSSRDEALAKRVITLIRSALNLPAREIRCTSVDGFRLPAGASTEEALRKEVHEAEVLVALITPYSMESTYVLFELGARWGAKKPMLPLLARGFTGVDLTGPLVAINALNCSEPGQLYQFVENLAELLGIDADSAAAYRKCIDELVLESSGSGETASTGAPARQSALATSSS